MKRVLLVMILLSVLLVACAKKEALTFAVIPSEDASLARDQWKPMVDYLSEGLDREIELVIAVDYAAVVEAMHYGHADFARLSPVGYVTALNEGAKIEPLVFAVKRETNLPGYYAYLVARADTDTSNLSELSFGFVDVSSTSGYVAPSAYLAQAGISPAEIFFAGSHQAVILAVQNGSVDIGAVASNRMETALAEGVISEGEFKIVWQSPLIPNCPIAVQSSMSQEDKDTLLELFLLAPEDVILATGINETGYVKVDDSDYDPIREILDFQNQ